MPIYEYKCRACTNEFEELVFKSDEAVNCPSCGSGKVAKKMSVCSFKSTGNGGGTNFKSSASSCSGCAATSCATCK